MILLSKTIFVLYIRVFFANHVYISFSMLTIFLRTWNLLHFPEIVFFFGASKGFLLSGFTRDTFFYRRHHLSKVPYSSKNKETQMTMENQPRMKMYLRLKMMIFQQSPC